MTKEKKGVLYGLLFFMFGNAACYMNVSVIFRKLLVYYAVKYRRRKKSLKDLKSSTIHKEKHHLITYGTPLRNKPYYEAPLCDAGVAGSSVM